MKKLLPVLFLLMTLLMYFIIQGTISIGKVWVVFIFFIQVISMVGYIYTSDIKKNYRVGLSIALIISFVIIGVVLYDKLIV
ncbi:hypothetical protein [uncultured Anaerococcus sp.]|uniref:hypothetical protein n=1 Tax=uncultured Anaerococcus sp. TaxID=293428 RepID=UPI0025ECD62F|nr:hypothetical protein [uncultured Anaerococcus sp.]